MNGGQHDFSKAFYGIIGGKRIIIQKFGAEVKEVW
jgi:hypothetical protein